MTDFIGDWDPKAVTAGTALIQITTAANRPLRILEVSIGFDGVTAAQLPIECFIRRVTTTGAASARTLNPLDQRDTNTIGATALTGNFAGGTEPTWGAYLARFYLHAMTPPYVWRPAEKDLVIVTGTGSANMFGIGIVGTFSPTINCLGYVHCRE
jgi:hypothetical protein